MQEPNRKIIKPKVIYYCWNIMTFSFSHFFQIFIFLETFSTLTSIALCYSLILFKQFCYKRLIMFLIYAIRNSFSFGSLTVFFGFLFVSFISWISYHLSSGETNFLLIQWGFFKYLQGRKCDGFTREFCGKIFDHNLFFYTVFYLQSTYLVLTWNKKSTSSIFFISWLCSKCS